MDERVDLYAVPIGGGAPVRLNAPAISGADVYTSRISPDGSRVVYTGPQDSAGRTELYSVPIDGGTPVKLNGPLNMNGRVLHPRITPDSSKVLFDEEANPTSLLYSVPIDGGHRNQLSVSGLELDRFQISPDGSRVVYTADEWPLYQREMYSVRINGSQTVQLNGRLDVSGDVGPIFNFLITPENSTVVYTGDLDTPYVYELFRIPITGGSSIKLSGLMPAYADVEWLHITPDSSTVFYLSDRVTDEQVELFGVRLDGNPDPDGDGILEVCDPCPGLPNGPDGDGDGWGAACDCDDADLTIFPGAPERCNGLDDDCDLALPPEELDGDVDGFPLCAGDCNDSDSATYPGAVEINDGQDNQCPGDLGYGVSDETSGDSGFHNPNDKTQYSWPAQLGATSYEVARSTARDFSSDCVTVQLAQTSWSDPEWPAAGATFYYLNRPIAPNVGSWGQDSQGLERSNVCP